MTMIKKFAAIAAAATAFAATPAMAQDASNSDGEARINIVSAMTLTRVNDLDFGTVILVGNGGANWAETISIDDASTRDCGLNGYVLCAGTVEQSAEYTLSATQNVGVTVTIPDTVVISSGANSLTVDLEPELGDLGVSSGTTAAGSTVFAFNMPAASTGTQASYDFAFGGSIDLDQDTVDGAYSGTILVEASYQ